MELLTSLEQFITAFYSEVQDTQPGDLKSKHHVFIKEYNFMSHRPGRSSQLSWCCTMISSRWFMGALKQKEKQKGYSNWIYYASINMEIYRMIQHQPMNTLQTHFRNGHLYQTNGSRWQCIGVQTSVLRSSSNLFGAFSITKFRPHQE